MNGVSYCGTGNKTITNMEINLTFDEDQMRQILLERNPNIETKPSPKAYLIFIASTIGLLVCIGFFSLSDQTPRWVIPASICLAAILLDNIISQFKKRRTGLQAEKKTEEWIKRYTTIKDIKYLIDDNKFDYFEDGVLISSHNKSRISDIEISKQHIQIFFENPDTNLWFPKVCVSDSDFENLLELAKEIEKELISKSQNAIQ